MVKQGIERLVGYSFYELHLPYYALIKAVNPNEAVSIYINIVSGDEHNRQELLEELKQVDLYYALGKYYSSYNFHNEGNQTLEEYFEYVLGGGSKLILIDGSLI